MNLLRLSVHGWIDYLFAAVMLAWPWFAGFGHEPLAAGSMMGVGVVAILYSLLTNYPLGAIRILPFGMHLVLDTVSSLFLIVSPYLLNFADTVQWPHVFFGFAGLVVVVASPFRLSYRPLPTGRDSLSRA